jgi:hypothetical protein
MFARAEIAVEQQAVTDQCTPPNNAQRPHWMRKKNASAALSPCFRFCVRTDCKSKTKQPLCPNWFTCAWIGIGVIGANGGEMTFRGSCACDSTLRAVATWRARKAMPF